MDYGSVLFAFNPTRESFQINQECIMTSGTLIPELVIVEFQLMNEYAK